MKHLLEIIQQIPPDYRTVIALMLTVQFMVMLALGNLRATRDEQLPLWASSRALRAVMTWLVCLPVFFLLALSTYRIGANLWR
jgi:heme/copper-type cytochrome/quinol oxidase subunit 2